MAGLHELAAGWFAGHGFPVEAIRHAQAARDWGLAARLLADHWPGLHLGGQAATTHELLAGFPAEARAADVELAAVAAADELAQGSLEAAERYLGLAERGGSVPERPAGQAQVLLGVVRLLVGPAAREPAGGGRGGAAAAGPGRGPGAARSLAWARSYARWRWSAWASPSSGRRGWRQAQRHLEQGVALARRIGRPYWSSAAWPTRR